MIKLQNLKSKMKKLNLLRYKISNLTLLFTSSILSLIMIGTPLVSADKYTQQIQQLQQQNGQVSQTVNNLQGQAQTYQDQINQLQSQIYILQTQINNTENGIASIQAEIQSNQIKLIQEKATLDNIIKTMYVDGNMTTLEMLATSKNISEFVTKEAYRNIVQNQIQNTLTSINKTQESLKTQNNQLNQALIGQKASQSQLDSKQSQANQLLAYNQSQQDQYNQQLKANNSQIATLQQQEIAANTAGSRNTSYGGSCGGGYPGFLCNIPQDSMLYDAYTGLNTGYYNRECVSYVDWKVVSMGHSVPSDLKNAGDWIYNVPSSWKSTYPNVGDTSVIGDALVRPANPNLVFSNGDRDVGHVMYVESAPFMSNGVEYVHVSQYNASLNGRYSETDKPVAGLVFIKFP